MIEYRTSSGQKNSLSIFMVAYCSHVRYSCCHILNVVHKSVPNCSIILLEHEINVDTSNNDKFLTVAKL